MQPEIRKTEHAPFTNVYAEFTLRPASATAPIHIFDFKMLTEPNRTGTVTHDMRTQTVEMKYTDGSLVSDVDAAALSDALLCWLRDNGYLDMR